MKKQIFLTCLLALFANCLFAANESIKPDGDGTAESPYVLTRIENLVWMGENIAECQSSVFRLENDIDASETRNWVNKFDDNSSGNFGFISIGDKLLSKDGKEHEFSGIFNGQNFAIKNLFASSLLNSGCGALFSSLAGANISNLKLLNINLGVKESSSLLLIGALAKGIKDSTVTNVHATGQLYGRLVGGIAASARNSKFSNCSFVGKINGFNNGSLAGGLIGDCTDCEFVCCRTSGSASCSAEKSISLGGLFGRINYGTTDVLYCYSDMHLIAKGSLGYVGGLVGENGMSNRGEATGDFGFKQCYSNCKVEAAPGVVSRGIAGWFTDCVCFDCYYNSDISFGSGFGKGVNSTSIKKRSTYSNWTFGNIWEINEELSTPFFATENSKYLKPALIADWFGTVKIQPEKDGYAYGETVAVIAEPYEGSEFIKYRGALDGKDAQQTLTIEDNITVEADFAKEINSIDLFGTIGITTPGDQCYVQTVDFNLSDIEFTNRIEKFYGTYDGRNHSILNWKNSNWKDNGLFADIKNALVCNLNIIDAEANRLEGGILVSNYASDSVISNCYVSANVNNCRDNSGAMCGAARNSIITKCIFVGEFSGGSTFGGLCDTTIDSIIDQCGVEIYSENRFINCFCGSLSPNTKLVNCFAKGKFNGQFGYTGMSASNCYICAEGNVRLGISDVVNFNNCYFSSNCVAAVEGVTGFVSEEEMKKQETYVGWDFDEIWDIDEGVGTPYFRYAVPEPVGMFALLLLALMAVRKR